MPLDGESLVSLRRPRYEMVPMRGVQEAMDQLPPEATVTVTSSPRHGFAGSLPVIGELVARGHHTVPHLAARSFTGPQELERTVAGLGELGVREVFVVAGDAGDPAGPYQDSLALLEALAQVGHGFADIGVTGYPESHSFIPDDDTIRAMAAKAAHATYVVSQICYDAQTIRRWVSAVRDRGFGLPILLGIPGVVDRARLLRVSTKIGLSDSIRFLSRQPGVVTRAATGYTPDRLIGELAPVLSDPGLGVVGWHVFTFNEIAKTERWRHELLAAHPTGAVS